MDRDLLWNLINAPEDKMVVFHFNGRDSTEIESVASDVASVVMNRFRFSGPGTSCQVIISMRGVSDIGMESLIDQAINQIGSLCINDEKVSKNIATYDNQKAVIRFTFVK